MRTNRWALTAALGHQLMSYAAGIRDGLVHGYCAPAVKSMSENWRAFCTRGYDPAASITLDTLPGAFMVEALSARVFGFSTWSILLPQVIEIVCRHPRAVWGRTALARPSGRSLCRRH